MALINERDLARINEQRRAKGLPPLTLAQARMAIDAASDRPRDDSFDLMTYLVLYEILSSNENRDGGFIGGAVADSNDPPFQGAGGTSGGGGASGDWTPPSDPTPTPETDGGGKGGDVSSTDTS